jgi:hypothetical protein
MKTGCDFENYFEGYYSGELSPAEELALQKHLLSCPTCPKKLNDFYSVHSILIKYDRPAPTNNLLETYHQQVNLSYGRESISQKFTLLVYRLTSSRSPLFRVAQLAMLIATGIIVGWILFSAQEPQFVVQSGYPSQSNRPVAKEDVDYVFYYLLASEMLLLEIQNNVDESKFYLDGELAQKLLIKTLRVREIALRLNNLKLLDFSGQMQMLLHQISNIEEEDLSDFLGTIKRVINGAGLIREVETLKRTIIAPQHKFGT